MREKSWNFPSFSTLLNSFKYKVLPLLMSFHWWNLKTFPTCSFYSLFPLARIFPNPFTSLNSLLSGVGGTNKTKPLLLIQFNSADLGEF